MATTTNFGWETPDDTDLVKDGALAIRTLGSAIDTSLVDLKGGTTGQVLSKTSNTDMDFTWVTSDDANAIQNAIVDAKGDLITATAADTPARLAVGTNGQILTADSSTATGLKWAAASSGAMTLITGQTFSNQASVTLDSIFTSTYEVYRLDFGFYAATGGDDMQIQLRYGSTTQAASYTGVSFKVTYQGTTGSIGMTGASQWTIANDCGDSTNPTRGNFNISRVGVSTSSVTLTGIAYAGWTGDAYYFGAHQEVNREYTGLVLKSSSSNITGYVRVYGLAKS